MRKNDTVSLFQAIVVLWPKWSKPYAQADDTLRDMWTEMLSDLPVELVIAALKSIAIENEYPPSIAELRKRVAQIQRPELLLGVDEAWSEVHLAIRKYGYNRQKEAMNALPPMVADVVRAIGYREICTSENPDVIRGQFRRMYEAAIARNLREQSTPDALKQAIAQLQDGKELRLMHGGATQ